MVFGNEWLYIEKITKLYDIIPFRVKNLILSWLWFESSFYFDNYLSSFYRYKKDKWRKIFNYENLIFWRLVPIKNVKRIKLVNFYDDYLENESGIFEKRICYYRNLIYLNMGIYLPSRNIVQSCSNLEFISTIRPDKVLYDFSQCKNLKYIKINVFKLIDGTQFNLIKFMDVHSFKSLKMIKIRFFDNWSTVEKEADIVSERYKNLKIHIYYHNHIVRWDLYYNMQI